MAQRPRIRNSPVIVPPLVPSENPATLIFIHGYNFLGSQFTSDPPGHLNVAHHLHQFPALQHIKIVIPEGLPSVHPSITKRVWYDIPTPIPRGGVINGSAEWQVEFGHKDNNAHDMEVTLDYFETLIRSEIQSGTPANRIALLGDSQGAGVVVLFLLTRRIAAELGTVISYAGFHPIDLQTILKMQRDHGTDGRWSKETILFVLHGRDDVFVPVDIARAWKDQLQGFKDRSQGIARLEWKLLDNIRHALISRVWPHVAKILEEVVPIATSKPIQKL